jgi:hypothetical protein
MLFLFGDGAIQFLVNGFLRYLLFKMVFFAQVWICPACGKQDDGSPMIGCDQCDDW